MTVFKKILAFTGSILLVIILGGILTSLIHSGLVIATIVIAVAAILFFFSSKAGDRAQMIATGLTKKEYKYIRTNLEEARENYPPSKNHDTKQSVIFFPRA